MGSWASSKVVTSKSWAVLKENRYLLAFPVVGFGLGLIPLAVVGLPAVYFFATNHNWIGAALAIVTLFAVQALSVLVQGGLVAAVDTELSGEDSSFGHGMSRAFAHTGPLIAWSAIVTVVTALISLVRGNGQGNVVGVLLRNILAAAADVMWNLITFFVVPFIVLEGQTPIQAIKSSASLFKARWGQQIAGGIRIGVLIGLLLILPALALIAIGVVLVLAGSTAALASGIPLIVIGVIALLVGVVISSAMRTVFAVALYRYAKDGALSAGFTAQELQDAVRVKA